MLDTVLPMMKTIAIGCQIKDKAFWPTSLAQAAALPVPLEAAEEVTHSEEDNGPLDMLGVLPRSAFSYTCTCTDTAKSQMQTRRSPTPFI